MKQKFLLLFSSGQDSVFFFFIVLFQQEKSYYASLHFNHDYQLNNTFSAFHSLKLVFVTQHGSFLSFFTGIKQKINNKPRNEQTFRFARYQLTVRVKTFYFFNLFITAHNYSDLVETFFLTLNRPQEKLDLLKVTFRKKLLLNTFFHRNLTIKTITSYENRCTSKMKIFKRKMLKVQKLSFSNNIKGSNFLYRPLNAWSRLGATILSCYFSFPLFLDRTNFSLLIERNRIRRHLLLYLQKFFSTYCYHFLQTFQKNDLQIIRNYLCLSFFSYDLINYKVLDRNIFFILSLSFFKTSVSNYEIIFFWSLTSPFSFNSLIKKTNYVLVLKTKKYFVFQKL